MAQGEEQEFEQGCVRRVLMCVAVSADGALASALSPGHSGSIWRHESLVPHDYLRRVPARIGGVHVQYHQVNLVPPAPSFPSSLAPLPSLASNPPLLYSPPLVPCCLAVLVVAL